MKKLLSYILIILIGFTFLSLTNKINASIANPTEACQDDASNKPCVPTATTLGTCRLTITTGTTVELVRKTEGACRAESNYQSWESSTRQQYDAAAAANTRAGSLTEPLGTCISFFGNNLGTMTERKCLVENSSTNYWTILATEDTSDENDDDFVGPIDQNYHFLAPLPGVGPTFDPTQTGNLGAYLNIMINLFIGICAVLAVIMIVMGGLEYMTSELISSKEHGKERISGAIFGLILALGAWTLLYTINPDLLNTELSSLENVTVNVTLENQIKSYTGKGKCEPITSGVCSPASLATAGFLPNPPRATQASSICNGESAGNPSLASGVDKCSDGNSFSFGLFQINIIAHANEIPNGICSGIFQVNGGGTQGACMPGKSRDGICFERDCKVINLEKYKSCRDYISDTTNNINYAVKLQASRGWGQWGAYNSCRSQF